MTLSRKTRLTVLCALGVLLTACTGLPSGTTAVNGFELERYLGTWYEIARLDHSFERGLTDVTATYSLRDDGGVAVVNRGYDTEAASWDEAVGKAYFVDRPDVGRLKVSFFGPFYGGYNILELDQDDYDYSLVAGPNRSYLWILARRPDLDDARVRELVDIAAALDFPVDELIYVSHDRAGDPPAR
jgi:apolipoprotein D and lipocalin family protein